ncbi:MAG: inositol monophosphatase family protein [Propionibacteriaceae bacterium]
MNALHDDLRLAHLLADNADAVSMSRFKAHDLRIDTKPDMTLVTDADRAVEESIRSLLKKARTRDAIHGEEGEDTGHGQRRWIIDPIDGTHNYARGVPVWATLIALEEHGQIVAGVVSAPALHRRWWASKEGGAWTGKSLLQATAIQVSDITQISDAFLGYSDINEWVRSGHGQEFIDLMRSCWRSRGFGDFWSYMLVAEGAIDAACEPQLALYDMAACSIIVQEAGGQFSDIDGTDGPYGSGALASNGLLHQQLSDQLMGVEYTGPIVPVP